MTVESTMEDTEIGEMLLWGECLARPGGGTELRPFCELTFRLIEGNGEELYFWVNTNSFRASVWNEWLPKRQWNVRYCRHLDEVGVGRLYIQAICIGGKWCEHIGNLPSHPRYSRRNSDTSL